MLESRDKAGLGVTLKAFILGEFLRNLIIDSRFNSDGFPECGELKTKLRALTRKSG